MGVHEGGHGVRSMKMGGGEKMIERGKIHNLKELKKKEIEKSEPGFNLSQVSNVKTVTELNKYDVTQSKTNPLPGTMNIVRRK